MRFVFDFSTLFGVKTKSQKLHIATSNVTDLRFLLVEFQEKFLFNERLNIRQRPFCCLPAFAEDHHIVRIANKRVTSFFQFLVQLIEHDVG